MKELSYQIGLLLGSNLANQVNPLDMDVEAMGQGIQAIFGMSATNEELQAASQAVQTYMQGIAASQAAESVEQEKSFLEENAKREEIVSRESGLQYEVLVEGNGDIPTAQNTVVAHYEGRLLNGKVFDSSVLRGQPATFPVGNLIQGWQEALQLMPVGSKWRLYIPSGLAYGANGAGNDIPPHSTLIFELELLSIQG